MANPIKDYFNSDHKYLRAFFSPFLWPVLVAKLVYRGLKSLEREHRSLGFWMGLAVAVAITTVLFALSAIAIPVIGMMGAVGIFLAALWLVPATFKGLYNVYNTHYHEAKYQLSWVDDYISDLFPEEIRNDIGNDQNNINNDERKALLPPPIGSNNQKSDDGSYSSLCLFGSWPSFTNPSNSSASASDNSATANAGLWDKLTSCFNLRP